MKFLLANYNYYPYHTGGSEVYVSGLAKFLKSEGHEVRIIASIPVGTGSVELDYSGKMVQVSMYEHEGFPVAGAWLTEESTEQIYSMYNPAHVSDWEDFFRSNPDWIPDLIHLHGYTGTINTAIVEGLRKIKPKIPFYFSYHTPVSCPKGTLYRFNRSECEIKPNTNDCTACQIHSKTGLNPELSTFAGRLIPKMSTKALPTALKIKHLVSLNIHAFERVKSLADHFFAFSDYIHKVLILNGIESEKITMIRHGIDTRFLTQPVALPRQINPVNFVFMGRMEKIKGILTLVVAWELLDIKPDRNLILLGMIRPDTDPEITKAVNRLSERSDVRIEQAGSRENLIEKLDSFHVIIIPSEWIEIGPLVFHEAISRGLNVIASDLGGTRELAGFYGSGCSLFEPGNIVSLKTTIEQFIFSPVHHTVQSEFEHYRIVSNHYAVENQR